MSDERLTILKLLEQGKITESEAEQLLDALGGIEYDQATQEATNSFSTKKVKLSKDDDTFNEKTYFNKHNSSKHNQFKHGINKDFDEILESLGKKFENLGDHLEDKFDIFGEQFGKKMITLGSIFADKSIIFAEKIIDVVDKAIDSDVFVNSDLFGNVKTFEEVLEKKLTNIDELSLQFESYNGSISLNNWDGESLRVTAYISAKEGKYDELSPILTLNEDTNILYFYPKPIDGAGVKLKIDLPKNLYNLIKVQTTNGAITADNLSCNKMFLQTKNFGINLNNVDVKENASCTTINSKIKIQNSIAENLLAATKNSSIIIENSKVCRIEGITSNSKILIKDIDYNKLRSLSLKTTNSKIEVIGTPSENTAIQVEASTTHGNVNIGIPVIYSENIRNYANHRVNAQTPNFDTCKDISYIRAYTTNGYISIL